MRKAIIVAQVVLCGCAAPTDMRPFGLPASIDELRVVHPAVVTVTVTPPDTTVVRASRLQYVGTARDGQGRVLRASAWAWKSSDTTVAVVSQSGLVTSRTAGRVIIVATAFPPWRR